MSIRKPLIEAPAKKVKFVLSIQWPESSGGGPLNFSHSFPSFEAASRYMSQQRGYVKGSVHLKRVFA